MNLYLKHHNNYFLILFCVVLCLHACNYNEKTSDKYRQTEPPLSLNENLILEVSLSHTVCNDLSQPIEVIFSFINSNDRELKIADQFLISKNRFGFGGNIIALITLNGADIYTLQDNSMMNTPLPDVNKYLQIPPHDNLEVTIQYNFPREFLESRQSEEENLITPQPGIYLVTFIYTQIQQASDSWHGALRSNELEVCINN